MTNKKGTLWLIPNTLGGESTSDILPQHITNIIRELRHFAVEEIKSARRLLRKLDRNFPIDECTFYQMNKRSSKDEVILSNITQKAMAEPAFDRSKVEAIKQAISDGNYPINSRRIAESFVAIEKMIGE
jgi:16S rRNA C1402 (ribose-2'-O) methylase RsmI